MLIALLKSRELNPQINTLSTKILTTIKPIKF